MLRVSFVQTNESRHYIRNFSRTLGDKHVNARCGCASAGPWSLKNDFIRGIVSKRGGGNLSHLQTGAQQYDTRSSQRISLEERNLQLPLAQTEHHMRLL